MNVSETVLIGSTFECVRLSQRNGDVVVLEFASLGQIDLFLDWYFSDFLAHTRSFVVPGTEVEHVALSAVSQTSTAGTGGKFGVETLGLELADELFDFFATRGGVVESFDGPVLVCGSFLPCVCSEYFIATDALGELGATHSTRTESGKVGTGTAAKCTTTKS